MTIVTVVRNRVEVAFWGYHYLLDMRGGLAEVEAVAEETAKYRRRQRTQASATPCRNPARRLQSRNFQVVSAAPASPALPGDAAPSRTVCLLAAALLSKHATRGS